MKSYQSWTRSRGVNALFLHFWYRQKHIFWVFQVPKWAKLGFFSYKSEGNVFTIHNFLPFFPWSRYLFFFWQANNAYEGLEFFLRSPATSETFFRTWSTHPLHDLSLCSCKSWFLNNLICGFLTWKSNLGIFLWSDFHEILADGTWWYYSANLIQIRLG